MEPIKIQLDDKDLKRAEEDLKRILKLIYQIEAVVRKSWLLRILFGLRGRKNEK